MTPILLTTLLTQMKWTVYLVKPRVNLRIVGLAGVILGLLVFYLVLPLLRVWWHLVPAMLPV